MDSQTNKPDASIYAMFRHKLSYLLVYDSKIEINLNCSQDKPMYIVINIKGIQAVRIDFFFCLY